MHAYTSVRQTHFTYFEKKTRRIVWLNRMHGGCTNSTNLFRTVSTTKRPYMQPGVQLRFCTLQYCTFDLDENAKNGDNKQIPEMVLLPIHSFGG